MKIERIQLKNFKRFSDLEISSIPATAKLILIVGPNGCGKSSLFDAFITWERDYAYRQQSQDQPYHSKDPTIGYTWKDDVKIESHEGQEPVKGSLYIRTAYRHEADFQLRRLDAEPEQQSQRILRAIDADQTVSKNYSKLIQETLRGVYDSSNDEKSVLTLREELIGKVQESLSSVFPDLRLDNIGDPLQTGTFTFSKGTAKKYHYKNLSGGEKSVFDLLLDIHLKSGSHQDSIYAIDEIETHIHTALQGCLLKELYKAIPDSSQLWVSTHSLGVMRAANELSKSDKDQVFILDFSDLDADQESHLTPTDIDRVCWEKMMSISLDDLSQRISPKHIVFCEGTSKGTRRKNFDADIYNKIFSDEFPNTLFVSGGNSHQVEKLGQSYKDAIQQIVPSSQVHSLVDRDDMSMEEVEEKKRTGVTVLHVRNIEGVLFSDEIIACLCDVNGKKNRFPEVLAEVDKAIEESVGRGNPSDDMKSAAGKAYNQIKAVLQLTGCGNSAEAFMRDTLTPCVTSDTQVYNELKTTLSKALVES